MNPDSDAPHLLVDIRDGVAVLTLNRPERLNALSRPMIDAAIATLERCVDDAAVGCIVVTGAGRGFCAGGDVTAMGAGSAAAELTLEQKVDRQRSIHRVSGLLRAMPKVSIAAINGACAGAGLGIALACDLRVAADTARLTTAFAKVGFSGDFGITWPLVRMLGDAKAKELLLLSEVLSAQQALELGLVNRVLAADALMPSALDIAARIARGPRVAYRYMKQNAEAAATEGYQQLLDREAFTQVYTGTTADHREGVAAFIEKREPRFRGG
ncbi:MAG TPA: enoyl-CoA hydratase-related protein [Caldimonas sp.]|nr:enoyl-CoA hydratase-related protein [Caldimonas sp.]